MAPKEPLTLHVETTSPVDPIADSTMVDNVEANSDSPPVSTIPHSVLTSVDVSLLQGSRIFMDICSGADYSLTAPMLQQECLFFRPTPSWLPSDRYTRSIVAIDELRLSCKAVNYR